MDTFIFKVMALRNEDVRSTHTLCYGGSNTAMPISSVSDYFNSITTIDIDDCVKA